MISRGLLVRLDPKPGKEAEVEEFLRSALPFVQMEEGTAAWFGVRFGRGEYGIVDVFPDEPAREAHLAGPIALALKTRSGELFKKPPRIEKVDVLASKVSTGFSQEPDTKGLLLMFKAKSGHEADLEQFLRDAQEFVTVEPRTTAWFAIRTEEGEYGIFDVFPDNGGRFAHLFGHVPRGLAKHAFTLLGSLPYLKMANIEAEKLAA